MDIRFQASVALFAVITGVAIAQTKTGTDAAKAAEGNLFSAIRAGKLDDVKATLSKGADINARRGDGLTPLMYAALWGRTAIVEFLTDQRGINLNALQGDCNATCYAFVVEK